MTGRRTAQVTGQSTNQSTDQSGPVSATTNATKLLLNLFIFAALLASAPGSQAKSSDTESAREAAIERASDAEKALEKSKENSKECQKTKAVKAEDSKTKHVSRGDGKGATWCTARTTIKAPPEIVWRAVHDERQNDPDIAYSKILEQNENQFKLEQKFCFIPFLGTSTCVTHQVEVPNQRIDYKLVKSDHFKAMEGSWVLSPSEGGKSTVLEFSSHLDLGLPVPRMLMDGVTAKKMEKRLSHIKQMAEHNHAAIANKPAAPVE